MNQYEEQARKLHKEGNNCSSALHGAFSEDLKLNTDFPSPRSIEGKCGALLTSIHILNEKGYQDKVEWFEEEFIKHFGYSKCIDLMKHERRCNDYIGESANLLDKIINK